MRTVVWLLVYHHSSFRCLCHKICVARNQTPAIPGIGIEVLTFRPVLVLVLVLKFRFFQVLVLVLVLTMSNFQVLVLVLVLKILSFQVLVLVLVLTILPFKTNTNTTVQN